METDPLHPSLPPISSSAQFLSQGNILIIVNSARMFLFYAQYSHAIFVPDVSQQRRRSEKYTTPPNSEPLPTEHTY